MIDSGTYFQHFPRYLYSPAPLSLYLKSKKTNKKITRGKHTRASLNVLVAATNSRTHTLSLLAKQ